MKTACKNCLHFMNSSMQRHPEWYDMYCTASPRPMEFDPYTGEMRTPSPSFEFCRDVNKGNCPKFVCTHLQADSQDYICANCGERVIRI